MSITMGATHCNSRKPASQRCDRKRRLAGVTFNSIEQTIDEQLPLLQPGIIIPQFFWMVVSKQKSDFYINDKHRLVVSQNAFNLLSKLNIKFCDVEPIA